MKFITPLILTIFTVSIAFSQTDDPCGATSLTVNASCSYAGGNLPASSTGTPGVPAPGCSSYPAGSDDVWYQVTVPGSGVVTIDLNTGTLTDMGMAWYTGTCGTLSLLACDDDSSPNGLMPMISQTGLTPGATIWVRLWEFGGNASGTFSICAYTTAPLTNDDPCSATPISVNASCSYANYTNVGAGNSAGVPAPGCANYLGGDVWFSVTVPASGNITFDSQTGTMFDGGMAIYSGTCGSLGLVACDDDNSANGSMSMITVTGQVPGATLWIRFWGYAGATGTFGICAYNPPAPPANDNPCTAFALTASGTCTYDIFTNANATATGGVPAPTCAAYSGSDVWFTVNVPASGNLVFDTQTGVILDGGMAVYSGTCASLTQLACDDDSSPNGAMSMISLTGQTPGATLWIRIWEFGNNNNGSFGICVTDPGATGTNSQNCNGAIPICTDASYAGNSNGFDVQELSGVQQGCLLGEENQTTWFGFSPVVTGTIQLTITPTAGAIDYDFAIWGPFPPGGGCPITTTPLRCSYAAATGLTGLQTGAGDNSEDATGDRWVNPLVITGAEIGMIYYLVVDNYSANTTPFTLDWLLSSPGMLDCTPPLPIQLGNFDGTQEEKINKLFWTTETEVNNDMFIIEKSSDAIKFTELGRIDGHGNTNSLSNYHLYDHTPYNITYYRLKQIDFNGDFKYYGPITVGNENIDEFLVYNVYPNPAKESFFIEVFSKNEMAADVLVYDAFGKIMYSNKATIIGLSMLEIQSANWPSGIYTIKIENESRMYQLNNRVVIGR